MTIGYKGERIDLLIKQGADFAADGAVMINGVPVDLSGSTVSALMRRGFNSLDTPVNFVISITNPSIGKYSISLDHVATSQLGCSEIETDPESRYEWEMGIVEFNGKKSPLAYGTVYVNRNLSP